MFYSFHDVSLLGTLSSIINITLIVQVHFGAYEKDVIDGKIQYKLLGYQMVIIPTLENIMFGDLNKVARLVVHQGVSVKVSSDFENDKKGLVPFVGDVYANIVLVSNSIVKLKVKAEA
ncbi:hypothetical protein KGR20_24315 [Cytobacillus oceanisediminis]|uniref:hypothetical protein n=1 Tax=Cytobacillus oceanisediminis TaxID=665099 RepID=UPI001CCCD1BB|nr:hypothetical protein [Cytobacillus oceanisediminis]MBZ9537256.1 hypothetical protein [Cytobacillus oceanisediminis]